jgi:PST family polysaccharide transporter
MTHPTPYRALIGATSVIGGASIITIAMAVMVSKGVAVLAGPYGVGLMGLYGTIVTAVCSALSVGGGGIRFIAEAKARNDWEAVAAVTVALRWISTGFAIIAGLLLWSFRHQLAIWIFSDPMQSDAIGWLALSVSLAVIANSYVAQLTGMGKIWDLSKVTVSASLISGATLLLLTHMYGNAGIVSGSPTLQMVTLALAAYLVLRGRVAVSRTSIRSALRYVQPIIKLGLALSSSVALAGTSQLLVRSAINHKLGPEAMGHFQAAWSISMTYIGFVLSAMAVDYFPRLSAIIADRDASRRLLNQQTTLAFVAACPIFLALFVLAPWVIRLLYATDFGPSVSVMRWQILGDVFKLAAWPLGFLLLAANRPRAYFLAEFAWNVLYVLLNLLLLDHFGIEATGISFAISYLIYLLLVYSITRTQIRSLWNRSNRLIIAATPMAIAALSAINHTFPSAALPMGLLLTSVAGLATAWSIKHMLRQHTSPPHD